MKKIYTFTPKSFAANQGFWCRDTGLINRTLRQIGVESKCIMPLPWHDADGGKEYLIRASRAQLLSAEWWRSLQLDWVVIYTWADPRYTGMVRAIHRAGIRIMLHLDRSANLFRPWDSTKNVIVNLYYRLKDTILNLLRNQQLMLADVVSLSPPVADAHANSWCYSSRLKEKIHVFPCPVATHFVYDGRPKEELVVCVGRWSDEEQDKVKRPEFLREVAERFAEQNERGVFEIYGACGQSMTDWYAALPESKKKRIVLKGRVANETLTEAYQRAMISICPSRSEGTHIASAEALNCGASIVTSCRKTLVVLHWYISMGAGRMSAEDTPESFAEAIHAEMDCWRRGERDPHKIAVKFNELFHVDKALARIFELSEATQR